MKTGLGAVSPEPQQSWLLLLTGKGATLAWLRGDGGRTREADGQVVDSHVAVCAD